MKDSIKQQFKYCEPSESLADSGQNFPANEQYKRAEQPCTTIAQYQLLKGYSGLQPVFFLNESNKVLLSDWTKIDSEPGQQLFFSFVDAYDTKFDATGQLSGEFLFCNDIPVSEYGTLIRVATYQLTVKSSDAKILYQGEADVKDMAAFINIPAVERLPLQSCKATAEVDVHVDRVNYACHAKSVIYSK